MASADDVDGGLVSYAGDDYGVGTVATGMAAASLAQAVLAWTTLLLVALADATASPAVVVLALAASPGGSPGAVAYSAG